MALWGKNDAASNAVFSVPAQLNKTANAANRTALYGNTTVSAFVTGATKGQFAVDAAEITAVNPTANAASHTGWHLRTVGTGSVANVTIGVAGTLYANTNTFTVTAPAGGTNATGTITTNGSGVITALTITNAGAGFTNTAPTVSITTATGSGATLTAAVGGRAGRVHMECLVAIGITGDGADDTTLPDS
jgi:hypothetical protein